MLCPECGKEVGPQAVLCVDCKLAKEPKVEPEQPAAASVPSLPQKPKYQKPTRPPEMDENASEQNSAKPYIIAIAIIALVIIGIYVGTRDSTPTPPPETGENPSASPTPAPDGTTPGASPSASPSAVPAEEITLGNDKWKDSVAIWDPKESELFVGLYADLISESDRFGIKSTGLLPKKPNSFSITFLLEQGATTLSQATVRGVKTSYRSPNAGDDPLSFSYVIKKELPVASGLGGDLSRESIVMGNSKQTAEKLLEGGKRVRLIWDLAFKAPIIHVSDGGTSSAPKSDPEPTKSSDRSSSGTSTESSSKTNPSSGSSSASSSDGIREGEYGTVSADDMAMSVKETFGLLYPETGAVSIGFYGQELTDADREAIRAKKVVTSLVNGKRPAMVFTLDFGKKGGEISRSSLTSYSAYFYRDSSGLFVFPGAYDTRSVRRASKDFQESEFSELSGKLEDGATLTMRTSGDNAPQEGFTKFAWKLGFKVKLFAVK